MDQSLIDSFRQVLESKSSEELRLASDDKTGKTPEEFEAIRQILAERSTKGTRVILALASGVIMAVLGAISALQMDASTELTFLISGVAAVLGFGSWYIPNLIPFGGP